MALIVKICGLKTPEAVEAALESGADLVGFVFFPPSPRNLGLRPRAHSASVSGGRAGKVALTVDANDEMLAEIVEALAAGHAATARQRDARAGGRRCARASVCRS